jgi:putative flippase GtrA
MSIIRPHNIKFLRSQVGRFLIVGFTTVVLDFIIYLLLLFFDFETSLAKAISFCSGAIFAYFANRGYTFQSNRKGFLGLIFFSMLYMSSLMINVGINELVLSALSGINFIIIIAFLTATSLSATINYIGMKYIIFKG